jgi:hypothetical protein
MGFPGCCSLSQLSKGDERSTQCSLSHSLWRPDLNPIEQMWEMGKGSINREQCNTPEELSVQAQTASDAVSVDSVNEMAESSSTLLSK